MKNNKDILSGSSDKWKWKLKNNEYTGGFKMKRIGYTGKIDNYTDIIEKEMRDRHPWIPEKDLLLILKKAGYKGKLTMIGNHVRKIKPVIIKEFAEQGILPYKFNLCIREGRLYNANLMKIAKSLVKEKLIEPGKIIGLKFTDAMSHDRYGKIYKIEAYKTHDGKVFEDEPSAVRHAEEILINKDIDEYTKNLTEKLTREEVNNILKQYTSQLLLNKLRILGK